MRKTRVLLLLAILGVLAMIAGTYWTESARLKQSERATPDPLRKGLNAAAEDWQWSQTEGGRPVVEVRAKNFRQTDSPETLELEDVELKIYHAGGEIFDRVRSASAIFDMEARTLYSDGEVRITLGIPGEGPEPGSLVSIDSSGVHFDSTTGRAHTDRAARFTFAGGEGTSVGAEYDPTTGDLRLAQQADLIWRGKAPGVEPMRVTSNGLLYKEREGKVLLEEKARLERGGTVIESRSAVVTLEDGAIRLVEAQQAEGTHSQPARKLSYQANELRADLNEKAVVTAIEARGEARLRSESRSGVTTIEGGRVQMEFDARQSESVLQKAVAMDGARLRNEGRPAAGEKTADAQVLESATVELRMQEGGEWIEQILTHAPGTLRLLPGEAKAPRRTLQGNRFWIEYAKNNQIESFRADRAETLTEYPKGPKEKEAPPPARTWSDGLNAAFDAKGEVSRLEQWGSFRYQEGDQRARAEKATLDQAAATILLEGEASTWDGNGTLSAATIRLDQKSGDVVAEGSVESTQQAPAKPKKSGPAKATEPAKPEGGLLSDASPMHARAHRMRTEQGRKVVRFEQNAVVWQGSNRVEGQMVEIRREEGKLLAEGKVRSLLEEKQAGEKPAKAEAGRKPAKKPAGPPMLLLISAAKLNYDDGTRKAVYEKDVVMKRGELTVRAAELTAWFSEGEESSLEKAEARKNVRIVIESPARLKTGKGENADYYAGEEKIVLYGEGAEFNDRDRGTTRGTQLTYFAQSERLEVEGKEEEPAVTKVLRR